MLRKALLTVAVLLLLCGFELRAQSPIDDMPAYAGVFQAITLDRTSNLNFGSVTVGTEGGILTIAQNGNRSKTGDIGLVLSSPTAAVVSITAQGPTWLHIQLPAFTTLTNGTDNLTVVFDPSLDEYELTETGLLTMYIGGSVSIAGGTPVGTYSGSVDLTVVYY